MKQYPENDAEDEVGEAISCPVSGVRFVDPVMLAGSDQGGSFERADILQWFAEHSTDPNTGKPVQTKVLIPNRNLREAIKAFICPLSGKLMRDPVILVGSDDGSSYERICIEQWLANNDTDPVTKKKLTSKALLPNRKLKEAMELFRAENPDEDKISTLKLKLVKTKTKLTTAQDVAKHLETVASMLRANLAEGQLLLSREQMAVARLGVDFSLAQSDLAHTKSSLVDAQEMIRRQQTELSNEREALRRQQADLAKAQSDLAKSKSSLADAQKMVGCLQTDLSSERGILRRQQADLVRAQSDLVKTKSDLADAQERIRCQPADLSASRSFLDAKLRLDASQETVGRQEADLTRLRVELANERTKRAKIVSVGPSVKQVESMLLFKRDENFFNHPDLIKKIIFKPSCRMVNIVFTNNEAKEIFLNSLQQHRQLRGLKNNVSIERAGGQEIIARFYLLSDKTFNYHAGLLAEFIKFIKTNYPEAFGRAVELNELEGNSLQEKPMSTVLQENDLATYALQ